MTLLEPRDRENRLRAISHTSRRPLDCYRGSTSERPYERNTPVVEILRNENGLRDISNIDIPWEDPGLVWEVPDTPYSIVRCDTQWDYQMESYFLAHCLGTKDHSEFAKAHVCFSLRDNLGVPHATILCLREDEYSPYGGAYDVGSVGYFAPVNERLRILQVRGRCDEVAMPVFHAHVRDWFAQFGGVIQADIILRLVDYLKKYGDADYDYHFRYLLDDSRNFFDWAHHNTRLSRAMRASGASL